jgi:phage gp36-like protein
MPYVLQSEIEADIPPAFLLEALDDDNDGAEDPGLWDKVAASVATEIDGTLGQRFTTPFTDPIPALVKQAAKIFALEKLYARRGTPEAQNPWAKQAAAIREKLTMIATGDEPLTPEINRAKPSVTAVTEPAKTTSATGGMLA